MTNIIQHGNKNEKQNRLKRFKCLRCCCVFETDENIVLSGCDLEEYIQFRGCKINPGYYTICPECGNVAKEVYNL